MRRAIHKLNAIDWVVRGSITLVFVAVGMEKLVGSTWVKLFAEIGVGQWFRYFTGAVQLTGALLLLIPQMARVGVVLLGCTMLGAILVRLFVLKTGFFAALVPALLLALVSVGWVERGSSEAEHSKAFLTLR